MSPARRGTRKQVGTALRAVVADKPQFLGHLLEEFGKPEGSSLSFYGHYL
jgi:hypothetical protein